MSAASAGFFIVSPGSGGSPFLQKDLRGDRVAQFPLQPVKIVSDARGDDLALLGGLRGGLQEFGERLDPYFALSVHHASTAPGTVTACGVCVSMSVDLPFGIPFGRRLARRPAGAVQRHRRRALSANRGQSSRRRSRCSAVRRRIASRRRRSPHRAALPPERSTSSPAKVACGCEVATMPFAAIAAERPGKVEVAHTGFLALYAKLPARRASLSGGHTACPALMHCHTSRSSSTKRQTQRITMGFRGCCAFPVDGAAHGAGRSLPIAPGVRWLRMQLAFRPRPHQFVARRGRPGWTHGRYRLCSPRQRTAWEQVFATHLAGRPLAGSSSPTSIPTISGSPAG